MNATYLHHTFKNKAPQEQSSISPKIVLSQYSLIILNQYIFIFEVNAVEIATTLNCPFTVMRIGK